MKLFRKIVDERQELEMMRVERGSFWVIFIALAAAILIQVIVLGYGLSHVMGEAIVLVIGCVWATIGYTRQGSWDYYTKPGLKSYIIYSLAAGFLCGGILLLARHFRQNAPLPELLRPFAFFFIASSIVTFIMLALIGTVVKKRRMKLQQEYNEPPVD